MVVLKTNGIKSEYVFFGFLSQFRSEQKRCAMIIHLYTIDVKKIVRGKYIFPFIFCLPIVLNFKCILTNKCVKYKIGKSYTYSGI